MTLRRGVTLLELLIALLLTGLVASMAYELFRDEHANYTKTREKIKLQSDAREGVRLIEEEIKNTGYKTRTTLVGTTVTVGTCTETQYPATVASFAAPAAGGIEFRFFNPFESFMCQEDDLWTIGYRLDGRVLERKAKKGGGAAGYTNANWVPFLDNVEEFRVEYGVLSDATQMLTIASQTPASGNAANTLFDLSPSSLQVGIDQSNVAARPWTISAWSTSVGTAKFTNTAFSLKAKSTYRISFRAQGSASFMDPATGATDVNVAFIPSSGASVVIPFVPGPTGAPRYLQYDFSPPVDGTYYLAYTAKMQAAPSDPTQCTLDLSGIDVRRVSQGEYSSWVDESTAPTPVWSTIGAVRIRLRVKTEQGGQLSFDRIIPVVNNVL